MEYTTSSGVPKGIPVFIQHDLKWI